MLDAVSVLLAFLDFGGSIGANPVDFSLLHLPQRVKILEGVGM